MRIGHGSLDSDQPAACRAYEIINKRSSVCLHYIVHLFRFCHADRFQDGWRIQHLNIPYLSREPCQQSLEDVAHQHYNLLRQDYRISWFSLTCWPVIWLWRTRPWRFLAFNTQLQPWTGLRRLAWAVLRFTAFNVALVHLALSLSAS